MNVSSQLSTKIVLSASQESRTRYWYYVFCKGSTPEFLHINPSGWK